MQAKACALLACEKLMLQKKRNRTRRGGSVQTRTVSKQREPKQSIQEKQNRTIIPALEEKPLKKVTPNLQQEEIRNPSAATEENTKFGKDRFKYWNLQITSFSNDFNSWNEHKSPSSVKLLSVSSAFRRIWKPGTTVSATQRTRKTGERERERERERETREQGFSTDGPV